MVVHSGYIPGTEDRRYATVEGKAVLGLVLPARWLEKPAAGGVAAAAES
jgi:hypothetical protein